METRLQEQIRRGGEQTNLQGRRWKRFLFAAKVVFHEKLSFNTRRPSLVPRTILHGNEATRVEYFLRKTDRLFSFLFYIWCNVGLSSRKKILNVFYANWLDQ